MERKTTMRHGRGLALAAVLSCMSGCEQGVQDPETGAAPVQQKAGGAGEDAAWAPAPATVEDRALTALLTGGLKAAPGRYAPEGTALAKSAAVQTCHIDFNNVASLSAIPQHASALYATAPWYRQTCGAHTANVLPTQGPQYYLVPTESNVCTGPTGMMGYGPMPGPSCVNLKDAALFPRSAGLLSVSDAQVGLSVTAVAGGYFRNFTIRSLRVLRGPVYVYGFKNPGGRWVHWGPLSAGYWNIPLGDGLGQLQIRTADGSGVFLVDDITIYAN